MKRRYGIGALRVKLDERGLKTRQLYVMQSNGSLVTFSGASLYPCQTLLSGPAAGVIGGCFVGRTLSYDNVVTDIPTS